MVCDECRPAYDSWLLPPTPERLTQLRERGTQFVTNGWIEYGKTPGYGLDAYNAKIRDYNALRKRQLERIEAHCQTTHAAPHQGGVPVPKEDA